MRRPLPSLVCHHIGAWGWRQRARHEGTVSGYYIGRDSTPILRSSGVESRCRYGMIDCTSPPAHKQVLMRACGRSRFHEHGVSRPRDSPGDRHADRAWFVFTRMPKLVQFARVPEGGSGRGAGCLGIWPQPRWEVRSETPIAVSLLCAGVGDNAASCAHRGSFRVSRTNKISSDAPPQCSCSPCTHIRR